MGRSTVLTETVHPSRGHARPYEFPTRDAAWNKVHAAGLWRAEQSHGGMAYGLAAELATAGREAIAKLESPKLPPSSSLLVDALVLLLGGRAPQWDNYDLTELVTVGLEFDGADQEEVAIGVTAFDAIVDAWVDGYGLPSALLRVMESMRVRPYKLASGPCLCLSPDALPSTQRPAIFRLRRHLSLADEATWRATRAAVEDAFPRWSPWQRLAAAYALATTDALADVAAADLLASHLPLASAPVLARACVSDPALLTQLGGTQADVYWDRSADHPRRDLDAVATMVVLSGERAMGALARLYDARGGDRLLALIAGLGTEEAVRFLLRRSQDPNVAKACAMATRSRKDLLVSALAREVAENRLGARARLWALLGDDSLGDVRATLPGDVRAICDSVRAPRGEGGTAARLPPIERRPPPRRFATPATQPPVYPEAFHASAAELERARESPGRSLHLYFKRRQLSTPAMVTAEVLRVFGLPPEFAKEPVAGVTIDVAARFASRRSTVPPTPAMLNVLPDAVALEVWSRLPANVWHFEHRGTWRALRYTIARFGLAALEGMLRLAKRWPTNALRSLQPVDSAGVAMLAAMSRYRSHYAARLGRRWILRHPKAAAAGLLAPAIGPEGHAQRAAREGLWLLMRHGYRPLLEDAGRLLGETANVELSRILTAPHFPLAIARPWPSWLRRRYLPYLVEAETAKTTGEQDVERLVCLLQGSRMDVVPPLLEAPPFTPTSLAGFSWALLDAYFASGAPPDGQWVMNALAWFGDETVLQPVSALLSHDANVRVPRGVVFDVLIALARRRVPGAEATLRGLAAAPDAADVGLERRAKRALRELSVLPRTRLGDA